MTNKFHGYDNKSGKFVTIEKCSGFLDAVSKVSSKVRKFIPEKIHPQKETCKNDQADLEQQLCCLQQQNHDLVNKIETLQRALNHLKEEVSTKFLLENQHKSLLIKLQFLLSFSRQIECYNDQNKLKGLLEELDIIEAELENEGLTLISEYSDEKSDFFAYRVVATTAGREVKEPAILRNGSVVLKGVVNISENK